LAGERVGARAARGGDLEGTNASDGDRVVPAEAVGMQRLARSDIDRERSEVRAVERAR
jgi:hypothetical protein